jgi:hypothetical protein
MKTQDFFVFFSIHRIPRCLAVFQAFSPSRHWEPSQSPKNPLLFYFESVSSQKGGRTPRSQAWLVLLCHNLFVVHPMTLPVARPYCLSRWLGKDSERSGHELIDVLARNLPRGTEETYEQSQSEHSINSKGFWRWRVTLITTGFLDFVHRPEFYKQENTTFRKLDLFPSSGKRGGNLLY